MKLLEARLRRHKALWEIVGSFDEINLPDCWLVAGAVAQTVWNDALGRVANAGIKDADIVYFDEDDLSEEAELREEVPLRDRCEEFEFVAPNTILQWTGATGAGTATDNPQRDFRFQFRLFHGLTPETETSCFYFWSAANGYRQNDPEATDQLYREIAPTFLEDKEMVEAQQRRFDEFGERGIVDIASDANRMHMRRIVERLIGSEQSAIAAE
jgi:hypothetical protein